MTPPIEVTTELVARLLAAPRSDAIGAALALLLEAADKNPGQLQAVLHSRVERLVGQRLQRTTIIDVLNAVARGY